MVSLAAMQGLNVCKSKLLSSYCSTLAIADHCTASHRDMYILFPAGLACLTAILLGAGIYAGKFEVQGASLIRHHMQGVFLESVCFKLATVLIVGFIRFITLYKIQATLATITLYKLSLKWGQFKHVKDAPIANILLHSACTQTTEYQSEEHSERCTEQSCTVSTS